MPTNETILFAKPLIAYSSGLVGQLAFVLVMLLFIRLLLIKKDWPLLLQKVPAYAIGGIASFWLFERLVAFGY